MTLPKHTNSRKRDYLNLSATFFLVPDKSNKLPNVANFADLLSE